MNPTPSKLRFIHSSPVQSSTKQPAPSMTPDLGALSEMYEVETKKPERKHANNTREVLWYGPAHGFWVGAWDLPSFDYTHWMMLPDAPAKILTRQEKAEAEFNQWLQATMPKLARNDLDASNAALRHRLRDAFVQGALS